MEPASFYKRDHGDLMEPYFMIFWGRDPSESSLECQNIKPFPGFLLQNSHIWSFLEWIQRKRPGSTTMLSWHHHMLLGFDVFVVSALIYHLQHQHCWDQGFINRLKGSIDFIGPGLSIEALSSWGQVGVQNMRKSEKGPRTGTTEDRRTKKSVNPLLLWIVPSWCLFHCSVSTWSASLSSNSSLQKSVTSSLK